MVKTELAKMDASYPKQLLKYIYWALTPHVDCWVEITKDSTKMKIYHQCCFLGLGFCPALPYWSLLSVTNNDWQESQCHGKLRGNIVQEARQKLYCL